MKIVVVRTGGFAGMRRIWTAQVSPEEARQWLPLLADLPQEDPGQPEPDRFQYEITVGQQAVVLPERLVRGPWQELVERVRSEADTGTAETIQDPGPGHVQ